MLFVNKIRNSKVDKGDILLHFDVLLLYMMILISEAIEVIRKVIDRKIVVDICLDPQSLVFRVKFTIKLVGLPWDHHCFLWSQISAWET